MSWVEGARARLRLLFARDAAEARMDDEFRFHLEMEMERLMREQGLDAGEARRRALVAFGGVEKHKEALREGRGLAWLGGLSLDLKLGLRMLVKYPGLTIVGGLRRPSSGSRSWWGCSRTTPGSRPWSTSRCGSRWTRRPSRGPTPWRRRPSSACGSRRRSRRCASAWRPSPVSRASPSWTASPACTTASAASSSTTPAVPAPAGGATSPAPQDALHEVSTAAVDPSYFDVLEAPILAGRGFGPVDLEPDVRVVIVDQGFVDQVLRGQNPIGRRVRFAAAPNPDGPTAEEPRPWYEIVGVVRELGMRHVAQRGRPAGLYLPAAPGSAGPVQMIIHLHGDPMSLAPRVRTMATAVDPMLRLSELQRLDGVVDDVLWIIGLWLRITVVLSAIALLLSLAGIYAVLSFTVARPD